MPERELGRLLAELEQQLGRNSDLSEDDRIALGELQRRISGLLDAEPGTRPESDEGVADPVIRYIDQLETSHPTTTMILGRIADALNKLGI
jgi:hypothetical protein